jgi:magnesium chelatase family protein
VSGIDIYPVNSLKEMIAHLTGITPLTVHPHIAFNSLLETTQAEFDFSDIAGQEMAKRALEIAAAGGHNVFMVGTPGAGKTMMARAFAGILPLLTESEAIEVTKIYSISGNLPHDRSLMTHRPFRSPHHTTSRIGLIGGGSRPAPGEVSLSHRGVLFLDEFPEFPRNVVESLRQPMEDGWVQISRASGTMRYPSQFTLIAAANPCPCGYYGSLKRQCNCLPGHTQRYQKKISGPILDRIDLHLQVPEVAIEKLGNVHSESSAAIQARVEKARLIQRQRFQGTTLTCNAEMSSKLIKQFCKLTTESEKVLLEAAAKMNLSARSYHKIIKLAQTIADLHAQPINAHYIREALQYRPKGIE